MSRFFINSHWSEFYAEPRHELHFVDVDEEVFTELDLPKDILADPTPDDLLTSALTVWPRGAAWGSPDGQAVNLNSNIAKLTRAMLLPFTELYRRAWQVLKEAFSASIVDSLDDWERDYGLPGECGDNDRTNEEAKRRILRERVRGTSLITPADVVRLAHRLGYVVAVEEPVSFRCGSSKLGSVDQISNVSLNKQWAVHVYAAPFQKFKAGGSQVGVNKLLEIGHDDLICAIERIRPAWSTVVFNFSERLQLYTLVTENGDAITEANGHPIDVLTYPSSTNS